MQAMDRPMPATQRTMATDQRATWTWRKSAVAGKPAAQGEEHGSSGW